MPSDYDAIPYHDRPVAQTHPNRLRAVVQRWGVDAAPTDEARILELGCAHGANLLPIAYRWRGTRCLGIDLNARQIEVGRQRVARLGLTNLELRAADVASVELDGPFDYVIAHGLFSWVPAPVRDAIVALCRRVLAPSGVAYVSYNALPGWGVRGGVRAALIEATRGATDPADKAQRARTALAALATIQPLQGTAEGEVIRVELEELVSRPDGYLLHEYLVPDMVAFTVREFVDKAQAHGLQYVDDVAPDGLEQQQRQQMRASVRGLGLDRVGVEQVVDLISYRQFRASLLVGAEQALRAEPFPDEEGTPASPPSTIGQLPSVSDLTRLEVAECGWASTPDHRVAPVDPFHAALVERLDGTRSAAALAQAMADEIRSGRLRAAGSQGVAPSDDELARALPTLVRDALARLAAAGLLS